MNRLKTIKLFYEKVGGVNAKWISEFQKLYQIPQGREFTDRTIDEIVDELADNEFDFATLKELISYEQSVQSEFISITQQINANIQNKGRITTLNRLYKELLDIMETIKSSYITINSYQNYEQTTYNIKLEVDDINVLHKKKIELKKRALKLKDLKKKK